MEEIMSKLSREELQKIIAEDLPGYRVANEDEGSVADAPVFNEGINANAEAETPDLSELRVKYLREKYLGEAADNLETEAAPENDSAPEEDPTEDEIVAVTPDNPAHPWDRGGRPKATVVSAKEKKVIGQQG
jgi:hypothetical protein